AADLVLFDPQGSTLAGESWYSKGQNSPFVGHCLPGRVRYTLVDGHLTHEG
ncbi:dihydroorotase, partial [Pseudomonas aeruginosa]|nr:dihydroorotase [Pseudomonas aeruginosa]